MKTAIVMSDNDENVPASIREECQRLRKLTDDEIGQEFDVALNATTEHFIKLAAIVRVKEERGCDLSELRIGMIDYLRKIAYGQLMPEMMADHGHRASLLKNLANLPLQDQGRVYREGVRVGRLTDKGEIDSVLMPLADLPTKQIRAVFAPGHVRSPEEQVRWSRFQQREAVGPAPERPACLVGKQSIEITRPVTLRKIDVIPFIKTMFSARELRAILKDIGA